MGSTKDTEVENKCLSVCPTTIRISKEMGVMCLL